jgi:hypothetical protein
LETGDFCVKLFVKSKLHGFELILMGVYGAAQDALKPDFLAELVCICESETLFDKKKKNNDNFNARWPFIFNAII